MTFGLSTLKFFFFLILINHIFWIFNSDKNFVICTLFSLSWNILQGQEFNALNNVGMKKKVEFRVCSIKITRSESIKASHMEQYT